MTQSKRNNLDNIIFENRAWEKAQYPRLHMKEPEKFPFTKVVNFEPVTREVRLTIGYHHGRSQRSNTDRWYLDIYMHEGKKVFGKMKVFGSLEEIKEHIREKYGKNPIFPKRWN